MDVVTGSWHSGEDQIHKLLSVPEGPNPTLPGLSYSATRILYISTLVAIGTVDAQGRPWTTLLSGSQGFAKPVQKDIIGLQAFAELRHDPVLEILLDETNKVQKAEDVERALDFAALGIDLASRTRVKMLGKLLAGTVIDKDEEVGDVMAKIQLILAVQGSLTNCPKYLNEKDIVPAVPEPELEAQSLPLSSAACDLLSAADMLFLTSYHPSHMSTNHRGGPPGFVRVAKNDESGTVLVYPEYSGNRLYQTLGNLILDPKVGIVFPDFRNGNVLYITGTTKILFGQNAAESLPRSNLAIQIRVDDARFVKKGLAFRGVEGERSPYNPPVRYLKNEKVDASDVDDLSQSTVAQLLSRTSITPTIARFRFRIVSSERAKRVEWKVGQHVALSFEDELSGGYAHMNDADPRSLNDDYVRTFTVSSPPSNASDEFEITIRNVGKATSLLFKTNPRAGLEIPLRGFGGTFSVIPAIHDKTTVDPANVQRQAIAFVAGGIGITPLLPHLASLDTTQFHLHLLWSLNVKDIQLAVDLLQHNPTLSHGVEVIIFISGWNHEPAHQTRHRDTERQEQETSMTRLQDEFGARVVKRRILESDITSTIDQIQDPESGASQGKQTWYICAGPALRKDAVSWLNKRGIEGVYEDFSY